MYSTYPRQCMIVYCGIPVTSGANIRYRDNQGNSALSLAIKQAYQRIVELLMQVTQHVPHI